MPCWQQCCCFAFLHCPQATRSTGPEHWPLHLPHEDHNSLPWQTNTRKLQATQAAPASNAALALRRKPSPVLGPVARTPPKSRSTRPMQYSVCTAALAQLGRNASRPGSLKGCSNVGVTVPGCLLFCWDKNRTVETCACCFAGHEMVGRGSNSSCQACPVGTYAGTSWNVCAKCRTGYSTFSDRSLACNGERALKFCAAAAQGLCSIVCCA